MDKEKPIYTSEGQVADPDLAREAAEIENKYRRKFLGIFEPSEKRIAKGERLAELHVEQSGKIKPEELPQKVIHAWNKFADEYPHISGDTRLRFIEVSRADLGGDKLRFRIEGYLKERGTGEIINPMEMTWVEVIIDITAGGKVEYEELRIRKDKSHIR